MCSSIGSVIVTGLVHMMGMHVMTVLAFTITVVPHNCRLQCREWHFLLHVNYE